MYGFMENLQKLSRIIIKYSFLSRALHNFPENPEPGGSDTEVTPLRMTLSRILLTIPQEEGTAEQTENAIDGVVENDLEYESMDSSVSGGSQSLR